MRYELQFGAFLGAISQAAVYQFSFCSEASFAYALHLLDLLA
jgi:hypothetical protein